jgi:hypothetical protein
MNNGFSASRFSGMAHKSGSMSASLRTPHQACRKTGERSDAKDYAAPR